MTADKEPETEEGKPSFTAVNQLSDHSNIGCAPENAVPYILA